jgi:hypothetical protein
LRVSLPKDITTGNAFSAKRISSVSQSSCSRHSFNSTPSLLSCKNKRRSSVSVSSDMNHQESQTCDGNVSPGKSTSLSLVIVTPARTPVRTPRQALFREGFCRERCENSDCGCYKAQVEQNCQSCRRRIREGHCIIKFQCGWCHVLCHTDEERGMSSIVKGFNEVQAIESTPSSGMPPRILFGTDKNNHVDEGQED